VFQIAPVRIHIGEEMPVITLIRIFKSFGKESQRVRKEKVGFPASIIKEFPCIGLDLIIRNRGIKNAIGNSGKNF
jgi:hypothetical protein